VVVFAYASVATSSLSSSGTYSPASDPLTPFWIVTAFAWFLGNLGYAIALVRARAMSTVGAWLVLAGAVVGIAVTAVLGENVPPAAYLLFGVFGIGWIVIGYAIVQPGYRSAG